MSRKLIFLDIDGTLALPGTTAPVPSALRAIRDAQARGHRVFLSSGRNLAMIRPFLGYGFDGVVASAGGYIRCRDRVLYDCPMTDAQRDETLRLLGEGHVLRTVECLEETYSDDLAEAFRDADPKLMNSEMMRWHRQCSENLGMRPLAEYGGEPVYKVAFLCAREDQLDSARARLEGDFAFCTYRSDSGGYLNGELINRAFDKGRALLRVCEALGVDASDTVGFGDNLNDLELIQTAGTGVCMGNGHPDLKARADLICRPIEEDGLAWAFVHLGLADRRAVWEA